MEHTITRAIRALIQKEIAAVPQRVKPNPPPRPVIEMPLRPGEIESHYPVTEVARLLSMSRAWVYERLNDGTFVTANFGASKSKKRIPASSIQAFIDAHTYRT